MNYSDYSDIKKLGWLSSYARQVLLTRFLVRSLSDLLDMPTPIDGLYLLHIFRIIISMPEHPKDARKYLLASPYTPTDRPHEFSLKLKSRSHLQFSIDIYDKDHLGVSITNQLMGGFGGEYEFPSYKWALQLLDEIIECHSKTNLATKHIADERAANIANRPIWATPEEKSYSFVMEELRHLNALEDGAWVFWLDLYDGLVEGQAPKWELWRQIALIDNKIWEAGPKAVADAIEQIHAELLTKRAPQSEAVIFDEAEQKFRLEHQEPVKPDLLNATLDQISDALEDCLENQSNGLHERSRETKVLRRALSRYANNPQRLEMDFTSVHGSLTRQILTTNELPPSEENLALMKALQDGAQGIRATHPDIAENRSILTNRAIKEMSQEDRDTIKAAEPVLEEISFGELAKDFEDDVEEIIEQEKEEALHRNLGGAERNPGLVAYDEKVRLFSRVAKIVLLMKKSPEIIQSVDKSAAVKVGGWISILYTLVQIGISLF